MTRILKLAALGIAGMTLLSPAIQLCACPESAAAVTGGHDCCAPGLQAADAKPCCGAATTVSRVIAAPEGGPQGALHPPVSSVVTLLCEPTVARTAARSATASPSSPPLILRI